MTKQLAVIEEFKINIGNMEEQFKTVLPKHINSTKFLNVVVTAVRTNPKLLELDRQSLFNACMDCAQDGLLPNGNESALIPFKGKVKYMPMVSGITKKVRNSGEISTIDAIVVYEKDDYDAWVDEKGPHFKFKKFRGDRGKPILTYAYAITKDGGIYYEEIDEDGIKSIEKCCNATNTPWKGPFKDEMRRKSALRRLCKYRLPSSTDIDSVIHRDDEMYDFSEKEEDQPEKDTIQKKSTLEKVIDIPEVEDAQEVEDAPLTGTIQGKITKLIERNGETKGIKWIRYGCKIDEKFYGTFSDSINKQMVESKEKNTTVRICFESAKKGEKILNNITMFENIEDNSEGDSWEKEIANDEIPI